MPTPTMVAELELEGRTVYVPYRFDPAEGSMHPSRAACLDRLGAAAYARLIDAELAGDLVPDMKGFSRALTRHCAPSCKRAHRFIQLSDEQALDVGRRLLEAIATPQPPTIH